MQFADLCDETDHGHGIVDGTSASGSIPRQVKLNSLGLILIAALHNV